MSCAFEKGFESSVNKYLVGKGGCVFKINGNEFVQGIPDLLVCYRGYFVAIECKSADGQIRPLQKINLRRIRKAQGQAIATRSMDVVKAIIETIDSKTGD